MKQQTLAMAADQNAEFERFRRPTRRDQFLATMERVVPWDDLCSVIEPFYPKAGNGRPPVGLQRMLRMYFIQHWFNLSDEGCEDALLDSTALRRFVGIDLGREPVPDATTMLRFRRLLNDTVTSSTAAFDDQTSDRTRRLERHQTDQTRAFNRALTQLKQLQHNRAVNLAAEKLHNATNTISRLINFAKIHRDYLSIAPKSDLHKTKPITPLTPSLAAQNRPNSLPNIG